MSDYYRVTAEMVGVHDLHPEYPLLPGDVLAKQPDGRFTKVAPGLCIVGFRPDELHIEQMDEPPTIVLSGSL